MAFGLGLSASACKDDFTPEEQIRRVLDEGVTALEKNDLGAATDLLSEQYADEAGRDRQKMKQIAFVLLRRGPVRVALRDVKIAVEGEQATVNMNAYALQGAKEIAAVEDLLPQSARQLTLEVKLANEGDEWRVRSIEGDGMGNPGGM